MFSCTISDRIVTDLGRPSADRSGGASDVDGQIRDNPRPQVYEFTWTRPASTRCHSTSRCAAEVSKSGETLVVTVEDAADCRV